MENLFKLGQQYSVPAHKYEKMVYEMFLKTQLTEQGMKSQQIREQSVGNQHKNVRVLLD